MPRIEERSDDFKRYILHDEGKTPSRVEILPERGALVTSFVVGKRELLYLDPATLADRSKNVRGGIPVLFPMAGKLADEKYTVDGRSYTMKQHGFARNSAWTVRDRKTDTDARLTLSLASNDATRAMFPWDFEVRLTYVLSGNTLRIEQRYENRSSTPMPLHAGFHPYFAVPDNQKAATSITTDANRAYDNARGVTKTFTGFDLTKSEVDMFLLDHTLRETVLERADGNNVEIDMDPSFTTLVVWTVAGKDYVCVEPWTARGNALNTREHLIEIAPGAAHEAVIAIKAL